MNDVTPKIKNCTCDCDRDLLDEFLNSSSFRLEQAGWIDQLGSCNSCQEYLAAQAAGEEVWDNAAELLQPTEFDQAGTADYSAATISSEYAQHPVAAQDVLNSLTPSENPMHLGRLGTHEVTGVVGVGGMGVVLKAIDPSLDRVVAVKVMAPQLANNEKARKRFAREAKAAAAVLHPNVVPIHSVSSDEKIPYLVMSYVRGGSLQKRLESQGPLPIVEVLRIGSQIADGLSAAHGQGLIHRDIKPENILLEQGVERVTITDFGLARAVDDNTMTQQGSIAGTPQYMSPEQARGERLDQQTDLFSLGSVLYALCTGRAPYRGDSSFGVMRQIIDEQPVAVRELNPEVPWWLANIIEKLMSKEKSDRFETAAAVHQLLERCLSHAQQPDSIDLPTIPGRSRVTPFLLTGKAITALLGALAVIFLILPALFHPSSPLRFGAADQPDRNVVTKITGTAVFDFTEINMDAAERLIGRPEHLTFSKVDSLTPEVAAILATHPANLSFPAITQLSPEVARALATKDELWLSLDGLTSISRDVATELAKAECGINLNGLGELVAETARPFAGRESTTSLGLRYITDDVAEILSRHKGWLSLNRLRSIEPAAAKQLAKHKYWLSLNGLESIPPDVAAALGTYRGENLDLNGLQSLDVESASELSRARCKLGLYLNGLSILTPTLVTTLGNGNSGLSFQGLQHCDQATKEALDALRKDLQGNRKMLMLPDLRLVSADTQDSFEPENNADPLERLAELIGAWSKLKNDSEAAKLLEAKAKRLISEGFSGVRPGTEKRRTVARKIAGVAEAHLQRSGPANMARLLAEATKPGPAIRAGDRMAKSGQLTEPVGWDIQMTHALALARAGKIKEALNENKTLENKIALSVNNGRVPDLTVNYFDKSRSAKSLLRQTHLQRGLILAIQGDIAGAENASDAADKVVVNAPTKDDVTATENLQNAFEEATSRADASAAHSDER